MKQYKLVNRSIVTTKRSNFIDKFLKNHKFRIHKGLYSNLIKITDVHIGYKIGEFSFTRKAFNYPIIKKDGKITKRL
jgi:ribosomal protein S19